MRWGNILGSAADAFKETQTWMQQQQVRQDALMDAKARREAAAGATDFSPDVKEWMAGRDGSTTTPNPITGAIDYVTGKLGLGSDSSTPDASAPAPAPATGLPTTSATGGAAATNSNSAAGLPVATGGAASAPAPSAPATSPATAVPAPSVPAAGGGAPVSTPANPIVSPATTGRLPPMAMPPSSAPAIPPGTPPQAIHNTSAALSAGGYGDPKTEHMIDMYMKVDPQIGLSMKTNYMQQQMLGLQLDSQKFTAGFAKALQLYTEGYTGGAVTQLQNAMGSAVGQQVQILPPDNTGRVVVNSTDPNGIIHQQVFTPGQDATGKPVTALDQLFTRAAAGQSPTMFLAFMAQKQQLDLQAQEVQARLSEAGAAWANARTAASRAAVENNLTAEQTAALHLQNTISTQTQAKVNSARSVLTNPQSTPAMRASAQQDLALYGGQVPTIGTYIKPDNSQGTYIQAPGGKTLVQDAAHNWVNMNANQDDANLAYADKGTVVGGKRYYVQPNVDNTGMYHFKIVAKDGTPFDNNVYDSAASALGALDGRSDSGLPGLHTFGTPSAGPVIGLDRAGAGN